MQAAAGMKNSNVNVFHTRLDKKDTLSTWNTEVFVKNRMDCNFLEGISLPALFVVRSMPLDRHATGPLAASDVDEVTLTSTTSLSSSSP